MSCKNITVSYEIITVSYDNNVVSYEIITLSYDNISRRYAKIF